MQTPAEPRASSVYTTGHWSDYLRALGISTACTLLVFPWYPGIDLVNIAMVYLLGSTIGALRLGRGPLVLLALANMLAYDYFFVPPAFSFEVEDARYLSALAVVLFVSLVISNLMVGIRRHKELADARERRTAVLYSMSRELAVATDAASMAAAAARHVSETFQGAVAVFVASAEDRLSGMAATDTALSPDMAIAAEVMRNGERRLADGIYLPLPGVGRTHGLMLVRLTAGISQLQPEQLDLLDAIASQLALSMQRASLVEAADAARFAADQATLRNTLLASISHDLRTPLSAIAGAGNLLAQPGYALNGDRRTMLGELIERKAGEMAALLANVLELARLEGGATLRADWHAIEDLIAIALRTNEVRLAGWRVAVHSDTGSLLVLVDANLVVQMLNNLLENAVKYTPPGTTIAITSTFEAGQMRLTVADDGPGLPCGDPELLFEKFRQGRRGQGLAGVGLGLAICRACARLHGGDITATANPGGGARFEILLPVATRTVVPDEVVAD
jgi:two-component system sensor histidine kinase KdpD